MEDAEQAPQDIPVSHATTRRGIEEFALVLTTAGIGSSVHHLPDGFALSVSPAHHARARAVLSAWAKENQPEPVLAGTALPPRAHPLELLFSYAAAASLLVAHLWMSKLPAYPVLLGVGSGRAASILGGEYWRTLTALCLHSDQAHVVGNVMIGGFFLGALTRSAGPGVGLLAVITTSAMGNFVNALFHQTDHTSIGASTAVFAAVGVLSGLEAWRRNRLKQRWRGSLYPIAGGIGVLAMLGAPGGRTDFGAHAFGLLAGMVIGFALATHLRGQRPRASLQLASGALAIAAVAGAWVLALQSQG